MKSQNISTYYKTRVVRQCRQMVDIWHSGRQIDGKEYKVQKKIHLIITQFQPTHQFNSMGENRIFSRKSDRENKYPYLTSYRKFN